MCRAIYCIRYEIIVNASKKESQFAYNKSVL